MSKKYNNIDSLNINNGINESINEHGTACKNKRASKSSQRKVLSDITNSNIKLGKNYIYMLKYQIYNWNRIIDIYDYIYRIHVLTYII